jgi:hypothetical protein
MYRVVEEPLSADAVAAAVTVPGRRRRLPGRRA